MAHTPNERQEVAQRTGVSISRRGRDYILEHEKASKEEKDAAALESFNSFITKTGCNPSDFGRAKHSNLFNVAMIYCCSFYMHISGVDDGRIGKLLHRDRTTVLDGRKIVAEMILTQNFGGRFYYKLILEKIL